MKNIDKQDNHFLDDDEVQITDLDSPDTPQSRRAMLIRSALKKTLGRRWIRYTLSGSLILLLLGVLLLQWPRPTSTPSSPPQASSRVFLSAAASRDTLFLQSSDFTLTAYSTANWHARWQVHLPAAINFQVVGSMLFCSYALSAHKTVLLAINTSYGKTLWQDVLPDAFTNLMQISKGQAIPVFIFANTMLYGQTTANAVYAIQANSGRINWIYQAHDTQHMAISGTLSAPLLSGNGVVEFTTTSAMTHVLDARTGRQILSAPNPSLAWPGVDIYGQLLLTFPTLGVGSAIQAFRISDGQRIWSYQLPEDTSIKSYLDGVIYLDAHDGATLIALSENTGHVLWRLQTSDGQAATDSFFPENGIGYLLQQDDTLLSLRISDGHVLWHTPITNLKGIPGSNISIVPHQQVIILNDVEPNSTIFMDVVSASDGHLLWHSSNSFAPFYPQGDAIYTLGSNGQLDSWRVDNGQHLWTFHAPAGSNIVLWSFQDASSLLFLDDLTGHLYALRTTDGKLLWRYP